MSSTTRTTIVRPADLTPNDLRLWEQYQQADDDFSSPYFRPEFTLDVSKLRDDVSVAVCEEGGRAVGYFPFQRSTKSTIVPVGGLLNDFHGVVSSAGVDISIPEMLRQARLPALAFHHLIRSSDLEEHVDHAWESVSMDVTGGYDAYLDRRVRKRNNHWTNTLRRSRKMNRELGPVRFEFHTDDSEAFEKLMEWKSVQYHKTGKTDVFSAGWTVELLRSFLEREDPRFRGVLSALYVREDTLAAVHFGLRASGVLHYWFPAFNDDYRKYSVGHLLLLEIARDAQANGVERIDLGAVKAGTAYKAEFMTPGSVSVAAGRVERSRLARTLRRSSRGIKERVKHSPLWGDDLPHVKTWRQLRGRRSIR